MSIAFAEEFGQSGRIGARETAQVVALVAVLWTGFLTTPEIAPG